MNMKTMWQARTTVGMTGGLLLAAASGCDSVTAVDESVPDAGEDVAYATCPAGNKYLSDEKSWECLPESQAWRCDSVCSSWAKSYCGSSCTPDAWPGPVDTANCPPDHFGCDCYVNQCNPPPGSEGKPCGAWCWNHSDCESNYCSWWFTCGGSTCDPGGNPT